MARFTVAVCYIPAAGARADILEEFLPRLNLAHGAAALIAGLQTLKRALEIAAGVWVFPGYAYSVGHDYRNGYFSDGS